MNKYKIEEILSNIQFQVYSDMNFIEPLGLDKETWKELLEYINKQKEVLDMIKNNNKRIIDYGFDYDGFNNVEDLKKLIDMLVDYARKNYELLEEIE